MYVLMFLLCYNSLLDVLQADRFKNLKVSAVAVNGDTWNDTLCELRCVVE
jgi:hypothetical protein